MKTPRGRPITKEPQPIKGGYFGYSTGDSVRVTGSASNTPDVSTYYIGFRTFRRSCELRLAT